MLETWHAFVLEMSDSFGEADPIARVKWAGPDMSVRSSITARLMETWAHGLAIYDALGVERQDDDRIRNIAILGINTFGWAFRNRKLEVPAQPPYVRLTAPSGAVWEWNDLSTTNCVTGSATGFCQVLTQTRNVADTDLSAGRRCRETVDGHCPMLCRPSGTASGAGYAVLHVIQTIPEDALVRI